jgi:hypothetical protein
MPAKVLNSSVIELYFQTIIRRRRDRMYQKKEDVKPSSFAARRGIEPLLPG